MLQLLAGAIGASIWSFVLAAIALRTKHWRNGRLLAKGGAPYKDCIFAWPVAVMTTILGVVACVVVALVHGSWLATALAAFLAPATLGLVPTILAIIQSTDDAVFPD